MFIGIKTLISKTAVVQDDSQDENQHKDAFNEMVEKTENVTARIISKCHKFKDLRHPHICSYIDALRGRHNRIYLISEHHPRTLSIFVNERLQSSQPQAHISDLYYQSAHIEAMYNDGISMTPDTSCHLAPSTKPALFEEVFLLRLVRDLALGLNFLHSKGLVHRGLNLDNIILFPTRAAIADHAIAEMTNFGRDVACVIGSPAFSAPEVLLEPLVGSQVAAAPPTDAWSVGAILLFLLRDADLPWRRRDVVRAGETRDTRNGEHTRRIMEGILRFAGILPPDPGPAWLFDAHTHHAAARVAPRPRATDAFACAFLQRRRSFGVVRMAHLLLDPEPASRPAMSQLLTNPVLARLKLAPASLSHAGGDDGEVTDEARLWESAAQGESGYEAVAAGGSGAGKDGDGREALPWGSGYSRPACHVTLKAANSGERAGAESEDWTTWPWPGVAEPEDEVWEALSDALHQWLAGGGDVLRLIKRAGAVVEPPALLRHGLLSAGLAARRRPGADEPDVERHDARIYPVAVAHLRAGRQARRGPKGERGELRGGPGDESGCGSGAAAADATLPLLGAAAGAGSDVLAGATLAAAAAASRAGEARSDGGAGDAAGARATGCDWAAEAGGEWRGAAVRTLLQALQAEGGPGGGPEYAELVCGEGRRGAEPSGRRLYQNSRETSGEVVTRRRGHANQGLRKRRQRDQVLRQVHGRRPARPRRRSPPCRRGGRAEGAHSSTGGAARGRET